MSAQIVVGRDIFPGERLRLSMRVRCKDATGWFSILTRSGKGFWKAVPLAIVSSDRYQMIEHVVHLADWNIGDVLEHAIYQGSEPSNELRIDFISYMRERSPI